MDQIVRRWTNEQGKQLISEEMEELIGFNHDFVYTLMADGYFREFEEFQERLLHHVDWPLSAGLGEEKNFTLQLDSEIYHLVRVIPAAWTSIKIDGQRRRA